VKVCIFGAGAIGGYIGAKLAMAGEEVTLIARGPHLEAMKARGLTLIEDGKTHVVHPRVTADSREAGPQDYVFLSVKAHALGTIADAVQPLLGEKTALVPAINGVPWWYFYQLPGPYAGTRVEAVDPGGVLWEKLPPARVIGCIVYPATDLVEPGVVQHQYSNRFDIGEPDGSKSERAQILSKMMIKAGLRAPVRQSIRDNLWVKLWGNLSFNMLCALTMSSLDQVIANAGTKALARTMMLEGQAVAESLGVKFPIDVDARIAGAAEVGVHKPSTLIDLERGRPMEIDPLLGAVVELGRLTKTPMPACETVLPIIRLRAKAAGLYQGA
jgi:2-dehydropantoate 2-reductase